MPGAFAHMIAADQAKTVMETKGLTFPALILNRFPQWLQAGAVGPDYPYLHHILTSHDPSDSWANLLHYEKTGDVVRAGAAILRQDFPGSRDQREFQRKAAWFYGYASHVILDASIHPVVRAIVGEYDQNKTEHRACEMFMDSWIYVETYGVELTNSEWADYLRALTDAHSGGMDRPVVEFWQAMLKQVYPGSYAANPPQIDQWHQAYVTKLDASDVNVGFFRHLASENGLVYVPSSQIGAGDRRKYIEACRLPAPNQFGQAQMHYRDIFRFGAGNVARFWEEITVVLEGAADPALASVLNWDLDKGTIDPGGVGDATLWV